jgi:alpha-tubulin suppressor-like RCC1 family protein
MDGGGIQCWGWNPEGQLGDGTAQGRRTPVAVVGFSAAAQAVSIGWSGACALARGGIVWCWGAVGQNQNSGAGSSPPALVAGLGGKYIAVSVGGSHACALTRVGGVKCWGENDRGQLGNGATKKQNAPVDVAGLTSGVVAIAAGNLHTCALIVSGGVKCWGSNEFGQLGNGTTADSAAPVEVKGLSKGVRGIAAGGGHTCALNGDGGLKCWGSNKYGQLGDGTLENRSAPVDVNGLNRDVNTVSAGAFHTCAIVSGVKLKCWGWNMYGQLGDSTATDRNAPADVLWLAGTPASVAAGYDYTCALMRTGNLRCWGSNEFGQLGDGTVAVRHTPVDVQELGDKALSLVAGFYTTCALTGGGGIKCWGNNLFGQLGNGSTANSGVPVEVAGVEGEL